MFKMIFILYTAGFDDIVDILEILFCAKINLLSVCEFMRSSLRELRYKMISCHTLAVFVTRLISR